MNGHTRACQGLRAGLRVHAEGPDRWWRPQLPFEPCRFREHGTGVIEVRQRGERLPGRRTPLKRGQHGGERVGQRGKPGVKASLEDARATGQGLPAVLGGGELREDRLGPLAQRDRLVSCSHEIWFHCRRA